MEYPFWLQRRVEFYETDMAGIVHFSNFFRYMEVAEHAFLTKLGLSLHHSEQGLVWPRVHAACDFFSPLRFDDAFMVGIGVKKLTRSSVHFATELRRGSVAGEVVAQGKVVAACTRVDEAGGLKAVSIPDEWRSVFASAKVYEPE